MLVGGRVGGVLGVAALHLLLPTVLFALVLWQPYVAGTGTGEVVLTVLALLVLTGLVTGARAVRTGPRAPVTAPATSRSPARGVAVVVLVLVAYVGWVVAVSVTSPVLVMRVALRDGTTLHATSVATRSGTGKGGDTTFVRWTDAAGRPRSTPLAAELADPVAPRTGAAFVVDPAHPTAAVTRTVYDEATSPGFLAVPVGATAGYVGLLLVLSLLGARRRPTVV